MCHWQRVREVDDMPLDVLIPLGALAVVAVTMLGELAISLRNERSLLARGAIEPPDPVYPNMRGVYPAVFTSMAVEGMLRGAGFDFLLIDSTGPGWWTWLGVVVFAGGKALKYWAMAALGDRWTYRVLVLPGAPLVKSGPYRFMRHPNYVGVVGELIGMMLMTAAWTTGPGSTLLFMWFLHQRIAAENRALGLDVPQRSG
jgi:methyltransferase